MKDHGKAHFKEHVEYVLCTGCNKPQYPYTEDDNDGQLEDPHLLWADNGPYCLPCVRAGKCDAEPLRKIVKRRREQEERQREMDAETRKWMGKDKTEVLSPIEEFRDMVDAYNASGKRANMARVDHKFYERIRKYLISLPTRGPSSPSDASLSEGMTLYGCELHRWGGSKTEIFERKVANPFTVQQPTTVEEAFKVAKPIAKEPMPGGWTTNERGEIVYVEGKPVADAGSPDRSDGGQRLPQMVAQQREIIRDALHPKGEPVARDCDGVYGPLDCNGAMLHVGDYVEASDGYAAKVLDIGYMDKSITVKRISDGDVGYTYPEIWRKLNADDGYYEATGKVVRGCFIGYPKVVKETLDEPEGQTIMRCV